MSKRVEFPQSRCVLGVSTGDITPPVGMYHRMWGAAAHDRSTGVHRPLRQTTLALAPEDCADVRAEGSVFIAVDHCLLGSQELGEILDRVSSSTGVMREHMVVFFSHTHAAGLLGHERVSLPGGELIPAYFDELARKLSDGVSAAIRSAVPATIAYGTGHCQLATNRDYLDAAAGAYVCGFNPDGDADPTVLVARAEARDGRRPLATIVNYACHPTTLAWDNTLISPDYVGAMREVVEGATNVPCFFVQGASGDIGPREGFVGDVGVADRNGRQLGYAALSALEALPPPEMCYEYAGPVVSGATIGTWRYAALSPQRHAAVGIWQSHAFTLPLPYRPDRPQAAALREQRTHWEQVEESARQAGDAQQAADARAMIERMTRRLARVAHLPGGETYPYPTRIWRMGDAVWVALDGEHYNLLQRELRARFPSMAIVVGTLANGSNVWYLPDKNSYGKGLYQEDASILAAGSLETLIAAVAAAVDSLMR